MCCDRREWSSGIRRRSTHLFSQRSPGDVGQDEQDSVSCRNVKHNLEELDAHFNSDHVAAAAAAAFACAWAGDEIASCRRSSITLLKR